MISDPDHGEPERQLDRADHADPHRSSPLADVLRAAASPDLPRALAGEDDAAAAFNAAHTDSQDARTMHRRVVALRAAFAIGTAALLGAAALITANYTSARAHNPDLDPWAVPREVDTGFHAAMGISIGLWLLTLGMWWYRVS